MVKSKQINSNNSMRKMLEKFQIFTLLGQITKTTDKSNRLIKQYKKN